MLTAHAAPTVHSLIQDFANIAETDTVKNSFGEILQGRDAMRYRMNRDGLVETIEYYLTFAGHDMEDLGTAETRDLMEGLIGCQVKTMLFGE